MNKLLQYLAFILLLILCACSPPESTKNITSQLSPDQAITSPAVGALEVAAITLTVTPENTPTRELLPTNTPTSTATFTPTVTTTPTSTFTPTSTPDLLLPGLYNVSGCEKITLTGIWWVDWCVVNAEVRRDGNITFLISWVAHVGGVPWIPVTKMSDAGSQNMYLTDNLGNRYVLIDVGGDASKDIKFADNQIYYGIFVFPPAKPGAKVFTFHDSDNGVTIENLWMINPVPIWGELHLQSAPLTLDYKLEKWEAGATDENAQLLKHLKYDNCQIFERFSHEIMGKYKNTILIGSITYEIYGWFEPGYSVREYLVKDGLSEDIEEPAVLFQTTIPNTENEQCIADISEVLVRLYPNKQK